MKKLRFGVLGSGYMGRTHAEAIRCLDQAELVAVSCGSRAPALAEQYGVTFERDKNELLRRTDIDALVITTPHHLHAEEALAAFAQGKHVLVEKPMATSTVDCRRMIDAAAASKRTLAVGYQQRFRVNNAKARQLVREGAIGKIVAVQVSMPVYAGGIKAGGFGGNWAWWNDAASIGHLINSGPHAIDLLRWFTGGDVVTVSAFSRTFLPNITVEDTTMALFEFSGGAICSLFSSRALPAPSFPGEDFRFRIVGTTGLLDLDPYGDLRLSDEKGWRVVSQQPAVKHEGADTAFGDARMQAYCDQLSAFIALTEGQPSDVGSGPDGLAAVETCLAMMESSAKKTWVFPGASTACDP
jgi:predicted dehydrogenase